MDDHASGIVFVLCQDIEQLKGKPGQECSTGVRGSIDHDTFIGAMSLACGFDKPRTIFFFQSGHSHIRVNGKAMVRAPQALPMAAKAAVTIPEPRTSPTVPSPDMRFIM